MRKAFSWLSDVVQTSAASAVFFFGAMDGGIAVRRAEDIGFHGPFATISLGLGG